MRPVPLGLHEVDGTGVSELGTTTQPLLSHQNSGGSEHSVSRQPSASSQTSCVVISRFGLLEEPHSLPSSPIVKNLSPSEDAADPLAKMFAGESVDSQKSPSVIEIPSPWYERLLSMARKQLAFTGPGWLMSVAYIDPGNLEADLQCGAQYGYMLLWVLLWSTTIGLGMQLVAARLGCATRRHLAEHCREHYSPPARITLWILTEFAIIGSDIQEVIGCSIGLQMLLGLPLAAGVVVTAVAAFGFLFIERLGTRPLELFFGALILTLALSMGGLFTVIAPDRNAVLEGLVLPRLPASALQYAVGMVGCIIMPHNLFLHSALVQSRVVRIGEEREAVFLFAVESSAAIFTSLLINAAVIAVFAKGFFGSPGAADIGLRNAGNYLGDAFGAPLKVIWALGLVAAGQSSTMTGAYAGQWVMQGYLQLQVKPWKRAIITRSMALVPTLTVAIYFGGGNTGLDVLNSYLNVLQSLVLPFAVVPLLTFAGARCIMGELVLGPMALVACWCATALVMGANMFLLVLQFGPLMDIGGLIACIVVYFAAIAWVAWLPRRAGNC